MRIEAKWDWVVVKVESSETKTEAGVIIDAGMGEGVERGRVIATGIGKCLENGSLRPKSVTEGAYVLFQGGVGHPFMHLGVQYRVVKEEDICCQIHTEEAPPTGEDEPVDFSG